MCRCIYAYTSPWLGSRTQLLWTPCTHCPSVTEGNMRSLRFLCDIKLPKLMSAGHCGWQVDRCLSKQNGLGRKNKNPQSNTSRHVSQHCHHGASKSARSRMSKLLNCSETVCGLFPLPMSEAEPSVIMAQACLNTQMRLIVEGDVSLMGWLPEPEFLLVYRSPIFERFTKTL